MKPKAVILYLPLALFLLHCSSADQKESSNLTAEKTGARELFRRAFHENNRSDSIELYKQLIEDYPDSEYALFARSQLAAQSGEFEQALSLVNSAIVQNAKEPRFFTGRAEFEAYLDMTSEALVSLHEAEAINSKISEIYTLRAAINFDRRQNKEQILADLNRAILLRSDNLEAYLTRARFHRINGNTEAALRDFNRAIEIEPEDARAYLATAGIYLVQQKAEDAIDMFTAAIKKGAGSDAYAGRANARLSSGENEGDREKAFKDFNRAIELSPENSDPLMARGWGYMYLQQYEKAIDDFSKAAELSDKSGEALFSRGVAFYQSDKPEFAIEDFNAAGKAGKRDAELYYYRGMSFIKFQQLSSACRDLKTAESLGFEPASAMIQSYCS